MVTPVCIYYYGGFDSTVKQRLIATAPEFVVLNTPGGSYKGLISHPTPSDIAELKAAGIKVLSYISTGNLVHFKYATDSPPNDRAFVRGCIATVAAEGCDGIFFDEGGVGYHPSHADRYLEAPDLTLYGQPNSWAGYTIEDYASYAHSLGLIAVEGTDFREPQYLNPNVFDIFDYVLTDEHYTTRIPDGSEVGHEEKCWVIGYGLTDAVAAADCTNAALSRGFGAAYHCNSYGTLATWYESYISQIVQGGATVQVKFEGTVSAQAQSGETVTVTVTKPTGGKDIVTGVTDSSGTFSIPYEGPAGNGYTAVASIPADSRYQPASSGAVIFDIGLIPRTITLTVT
jgi:hypothetical protein